MLERRDTHLLTLILFAVLEKIYRSTVCIIKGAETALRGSFHSRLSVNQYIIYFHRVIFSCPIEVASLDSSGLRM